MPDVVDPLEILAQIDPSAVAADVPPDVANYRPADVQGIACAFCTKFSFLGMATDPGSSESIPHGICDQWEAHVSGAHVCDRFASGAPEYDDSGQEVWMFADGERGFSEIHFSSTDVKEADDNKFVIKEVLRTGEWPIIPTGAGVIKKPLRVVKSGSSDSEAGIISMEEVVANFKAGAIPNPQIPLSDEERNDHKNLTKLNTGFVRGLWIEGDEDNARLVAKMEFTEPEVKDRVLRGTYADVSCGIPWRVVSRGKQYGTSLEHVCITNRPFIDGLGPFLAASDSSEKAEVVHFGATATGISSEEVPGASAPGVTVPEPPANPPRQLSHEEQRAAIKSALFDQLGLPGGYELVDIAGLTARIRNDVADTTWAVNFVVGDGGKLVLTPTTEWVVTEPEGAEEPAARNEAPRQTELSDLEQARQLREFRLSHPSSNESGGSAMPEFGIAALEGVELSDDQRAALQVVFDERDKLKVKNKEKDADARVVELSGGGLEEFPGALKVYRKVYLADDDGPAVVLLSDDGREKERLTAREILDRFINGLMIDGKITFSDQALISGNDIKPPENTEGEERPLDERVADAKVALRHKTAKKEG